MFLLINNPSDHGQNGLQYFGMSGKIQTSVSDDPNLWSITYGPTYGHFHAFFIIG